MDKEAQKFTSFRLALSRRVTEESQVDELGNKLGLPDYEVDGIKNKRGKDFAGAAQDILSKWLKGQSTIDYDQLRQDLKRIISENEQKIKLIHAFNTLEQEMYGKGKPRKESVGYQETGDQSPQQPSKSTSTGSSASSSTTTVSIESSDSPSGAAGGELTADNVDKSIPKPSSRKPGFDEDEWEIPECPKKEKYPIEKYKRLGRAVIINNEKFYSSEDRKGTNIDAESIEKVLLKIGFDLTHVASTEKKAPLFGKADNAICLNVDEAADASKQKGSTEVKSSILKDIPRDQLWETLTEVAKMGEDDYACFCLFFLTHGGENMIMKTADDYDIAIKELTEFFKPMRCPGLAGKPKLFFIEACQGYNKDKGEKADDATKPIVLPAEADIFVFYATPFGHRAWRHPEKGSRFIQCLCKALDKYYNKRELLDIATTVNNMVSKITVKCGTKQVSMMTSTLRKPFYFTEELDL